MSLPVTSAGDRSQQTHALFARIAETTDPQERHRLLDEAIVLNMAMADSVVSRYTGRGVATDDLRQVAYVALTRAAHRFDPTRGVPFAAFAVPHMRGEVRKYFRDHAWMVRPTRRIQELQPRINQANDELWRELGRSPRPSEIAARLDEPVAAVVEALMTDGCYSPASLDKSVPDDEAGVPLGELLGSQDPGEEQCEARVILQPYLRRLSDRDRRILQLRYVHGLPQCEIAEDIGVTQMQVSRLLARIQRDLRASIGELDPPAAGRHRPSARD